MYGTAFGHKQQVAGRAVGAVLGNGVCRVLACYLVFKLHRNHRQAVNKDGHIQCQRGVLCIVAQLPHNGELVQCIPFFALGAKCRGQGVVKHKGVALVFQSLSQHIHHPALCYLVAQAF